MLKVLGRHWRQCHCHWIPCRNSCRGKVDWPLFFPVLFGLQAWLLIPKPLDETVSPFILLSMMKNLLNYITSLTIQVDNGRWWRLLSSRNLIAVIMFQSGDVKHKWALHLTGQSNFRAVEENFWTILKESSLTDQSLFNSCPLVMASVRKYLGSNTSSPTQKTTSCLCWSA